MVVILLITAGTLLYKFRLSLKLKLTRNKTERRSKDEEDQPSTNAVEQNQPAARADDDAVELKPVSNPSPKAHNDEKLPTEHVRPPRKSSKRRSSSVYSSDSWSSIDCSEYYVDIWSRQVEESRIAGLDIVAWWQSVYALDGRKT